MEQESGTEMVTSGIKCYDRRQERLRPEAARIGNRDDATFSVAHMLESRKRMLAKVSQHVTKQDVTSSSTS
jgi:hypothetical protein